MKFGNIKIFLFLFFLYFSTSSFSADKIQSAPVINLEDISPTFEEEKDELEKIKIEEDTSYLIETDEDKKEQKSAKKKMGKIFVNLKALDKITAKISLIKIPVGEKKYFGKLEIKPLKCALSGNEKEPLDTVAYIQVKDLSIKNNDQVFIFNGWTFASNSTLQPIDHPVYDLWLVGCDNV